LSNWRVWALRSVLLLLGCGAWGLDFVAEGEKQLSLNNPTKALTYLEAALTQGAPSERLLLNLGLAYQRLGQVADAKKAFRQGADLGGPARKVFLLNWGIASYLSQDWVTAEEAYTAALDEDPNFAEALLNRANSRISAKNLPGAAEDYRAYQTAAPTNPQKEKIDKLLALLDQAVGLAEATKLAEETRKQKEAEAQKASAEAAAAQKKEQEIAALAEKKKQDEILAKIRESLADTSNDTQALSTGPSGVKSEAGDFSLEP